MTSIVATVRIRLAQSQLARRFLYGASWSVAGTLVSSGINLILMMLVARLLGKSNYGQYIAVVSTVGMVGVFAGFGIGTAAIRYTAELRFNEPIRLGHILTLAERAVLVFGVITSSGLAISAGWLSSNLLNASELKLPLTIAAITVLFTAIDSYQKSVLIGLESMQAFATGTVCGVAVGVPIMLLAANEYGLTGAISAMAINAVIQFAISRYQMIRELRKYDIRLNSSGCIKEWPILWKFALPALLSGALVSPAHWATQAMLANTTYGYNELAVLGIAMQWFNVIMFLPNTAGRVVLPILTDHIAAQDHKNSRKILLYGMATNALASFPVALIVGIASPFIMCLYGKSYEHDYLPLVLAVATATLLAIQMPVGNLIAATSRMWLGALMNAGWATVYVGLAYLLIDSGATGIMLALAIGYVVHATWTLWYARRHEQNQIIHGENS